MIERIASIGTDGLAKTKPSIEHQNGAGRGMLGEYSEHGSLVVGPKMKEAVPGKNSAKAPAPRQVSHVGNDPFLSGHPASTQRDQGGRAVDAGDMETVRNHVNGNRHSAATAQVENIGSVREQTNEAVDPALVVPAGGTPISIP